MQGNNWQSKEVLSIGDDHHRPEATDGSLASLMHCSVSTTAVNSTCINDAIRAHMLATAVVLCMHTHGTQDEPRQLQDVSPVQPYRMHLHCAGLARTTAGSTQSYQQDLARLPPRGPRQQCSPAPLRPAGPFIPQKAASPGACCRDAQATGSALEAATVRAIKGECAQKCALHAQGVDWPGGSNVLCLSCRSPHTSTP